MGVTQSCPSPLLRSQRSLPGVSQPCSRGHSLLPKEFSVPTLLQGAEALAG